MADKILVSLSSMPELDERLKVAERYRSYLEGMEGLQLNAILSAFHGKYNLMPLSSVCSS